MRTMIFGTLALVAGTGMGAWASAPLRAQMHEPVVSADWLADHLTDPHVAVLHADMRRTRYEAGHLPGARFLDLAKLVWDGDPAWGTEMRSPAEIEAALEEAGVTDDLHHLVIYSESPLYAARAFMTLEVMGLGGRVQVLDGGLGWWRAEGREISESEAHVERGDVELQPRDDILVDAAWILERLEDESVALVDARPEDEYTGADGGMGGRANPGHIPGAAHMYWEELIESREAPHVRPRAEIERLFAEAGADRGDTVVAYCMVGWRASFTYLAARMLGYQTKFYDGSWHEWGTRDDLPYVTGRSPR